MIIKLKFRNTHFVASVERIKKSISRFIDLAPIDKADPDGNYTKALNFALTNDRIKNIAITGPYGSGKSSIIKTFEKNTAFKFLNISLASFKENSGDSQIDDTQNILIERSILQQMFYGANANRLPYSRFKRISTPVKPLMKSFILVLWALLVVFLYTYKAHFLNLDIFKGALIGWSALIAFVLSIPVVLVSDVYKASFGISFKKISLTNAEIETGDVSENSILNRHLDEIIYFFQSTKYDVVVIEDLDRFGSPEIFVKLREINKLINNSEKTNGNIKFLYALKDNMFAHKCRAKFFDFIIAVVPIINSSNSLDKMLERIEREEFADKIDLQFLREVSWYVDDLRLIHNIFNEFIVYTAKLNSDSLNPTKLLAMMIYKNVYPNDFELLHNGNGALYSVSRQRVDLITKMKRSIANEISEIQEEIRKLETESVARIEELIRGFVGHLIMIAPQAVNHIIINGQNVPFSQLLNWDTFLGVSGIQNIELYNNNYGNRFQIGKSFSQIQSEISPSGTFVNRKKIIENKAAGHIVELESKLRRLEKERTALTQLPLSQLLQKNSVSVESIISELNLEDSRLFVYLVKNGYIDETYHLYTSNFHEGRLTKNDRDFLLAIRDFKNPDPIQVIDTPNEVCNNMREEDFSHKYVLNVTLMDYLFTDKEKGSGRIKSAISYIAANFSESEEFFNAYWNAGKSMAEFTRLLSEQWPAYGVAALKSANATSHIALILTHVTPRHIIGEMNNESVLTQHLSKHGHLVFASDLYSLSDFDVYKKLGVKFEDLSSLEKHETHLEFAHANNLYEISLSNISFLMNRYSSERDTEQHTNSNYTVLSMSGCEQIKSYVDANLPVYINDVFLCLASNTKESGDAIKSLLNNSALDIDTKKAIVSQEEYVFPNFSNVPTELWTILIDQEKIKITWPNVSEYFGIDDVDKELLTQKVFSDKWLNKLSESKFESDKPTKEHQLSLARFFLGNDDIENRLYTILAKQTPYNWIGFHDVSAPKMKILVDEKKVSLCKATYDSAIEDKTLVASLIEKNSTTYFKAKSDYPIDDSIREILLRSTLNFPQKIELCHDVTATGINSSKSLAKAMGEILAPDSVDCLEIDDQILKALIATVQPVENSIRLLNKVIPTWTEPDTMAAIATLPAPYADIANYGKRPKLTKNNLNTRFAELLNSRGFISKYKDEDNSIRIITFNSADHSEGSNS